MEITRQSRRLLRLHSATFAILFIAALLLLGWLSTRYHLQTDWTAAGRNTLSEASQSLLTRMADPITVTAYARDSEVSGVRQAIKELIGRYQRKAPNMSLSFVDPDRAPDQVRELGIMVDGELVIEYGARHEQVRSLDEAAITQALERLARGGERRVAFLAGHGERNPQGEANHDLGEFGRQLAGKGIETLPLNLTTERAIPSDISVLVIAAPQVALLPGELTLINDYLARGGHLLWLAEPEQKGGLELIAEQLGIEQIPGVVVDPTTQLLGLPQPDFTVIGEYPNQPIVAGLDQLTLFPRASGLRAVGDIWSAEPILTTVDNSWSESGPIEGTIRFDADSDHAGPLVIGYALTRPIPHPGQEQEVTEEEGRAPPEQRAVVVGDGDFLSNAYLGNGANLDLGLRILNWLTRDDQLVQIPPRPAPDLHLELSDGKRILIALVLLIALPLLLVAAGIGIWLKRRKQ